YESPKFLLSRGRQAEAVATVYGIAHYNKTHTWLTEDILNKIGGDAEVTQEDVKLSVFEIVKRSLSRFSMKRFESLFKDKKIGWTTGLLWFQWATIGMAYPLFNAFLPQYLANSGGGVENDVGTVYRNYAITAIVGVPGSLIACYTVDLKYV
ncbi:hypothetical protein, partial [Pseudomonas aeruginosa]|uniref:hypothetical protein n=1 Tax=Pseudomonas aeruginosa TaxID=287 RepID=UPI0020956F6E